jgi:hypothetical protein
MIQNFVGGGGGGQLGTCLFGMGGWGGGDESVGVIYEKGYENLKS